MNAARIGFAAALLGALGGCNQTLIQTPIRSFDRPSDVALACLRLEPTAADPTQFRYLAHPLADCDSARTQSLQVTAPVPPTVTVTLGGAAPFVPFLVALVPQSARGELALVDTAQKRIVDLNPRQPGYNFLPLGKMPEHVRTSQDSRWAVTSNAGSCDYSVVNVESLIGEALVDATKPTAPATTVTRFKLAGLAGARPSWIEMTQRSDAAGATSHDVWVALPSCQLVVRTSLESVLAQAAGGQAAPIEAAIRVTLTGAEEVTDLAGLSCPATDCAGDAAGAPDFGGAPDMGGGDMGPPGATQGFPATLAIDEEGGRLLIGDGRGERIDIIPYDTSSGALGAPRSVTLEKGATGIKVVRVAPRSPAGQFLYAVARDNTVRVVDLDREVECETNPDPRFVGAGLDLQSTPQRGQFGPITSDTATLARRIGCFPVGDPTTPRRAATAETPGITLPPGTVPVDVAFVHVDASPGSTDPSVAPPPAAPGLLVGDFAWILTSNGRAAAVNIYDACPQPNQPQPGQSTGFAPPCAPASFDAVAKVLSSLWGHPEALLLERVSHRLRAGHPRFQTPIGPTEPTGAPRISDESVPCTVLLAPSATVPPPTDSPSSCLMSPLLPSLADEPVPPELMMSPGITGADPVTSRYLRVIDPTLVKNETWVAVWEGVLPGTSRGTGRLLPGGQMQDPGAVLCAAGVRNGDKLVFRGCTVDSDCDQQASQQCIHDPAAFADVTQGLCLTIDNDHTIDTWTHDCGTLLRSQRKYRITSARQKVLLSTGTVPTPGAARDEPTTNLLKLAEIYEPEFAVERQGCDQAGDPVAQCTSITVVPTRGGAPRATRCLPDWDGQSRCLLPCGASDSDDICGPDFVCARSRLGDFRCLRAPLDDALVARCMPEVQSYQIEAGDAYLVQGSASGAPSVSEADTTPGGLGECRRPALSSELVRLRQSRVPLLGLPACPPSVNSPLASIDPSQLPDSNVCQYSYPPDPANPGAPPKHAGDLVVHFENPAFNLGFIFPRRDDGRPLVPPDGTALSILLTGGGVPLSVGLGGTVAAQQLRAAAVTPDRQTVFVVDEGKSPVATGVRGQLIRLVSGGASTDPLFLVQ